LSFIVFSPDSMHQTLHSRVQRLTTMSFNHSIILWIIRCTWTLPHRLKTPVIEWMESRCISKMYFSHLEPPGVSERRRSVHLEASISGEDQTLGGHSGRRSE
jgi:hypothetical protein